MCCRPYVAFKKIPNASYDRSGTSYVYIKHMYLLPLKVDISLKTSGIPWCLMFAALSHKHDEVLIDLLLVAIIVFHIALRALSVMPAVSSMSSLISGNSMSKLFSSRISIDH